MNQKQATTRRRLRVHDLPKTKQPRERLKEMGVSNLTNAELLALILGTGTKKYNVLTLSKNIIKRFPPKKLLLLEAQDFSKIEGIGPVKAGKVMAALELGRRSIEKSSKPMLKTPEEVFSQTIDFRDKNREHIVAFYLNARRELIHRQTISIGSLNQNIIEPRDVFAEALTLPSPFVVITHNHPSGDPTPSDDDIIFTKNLVDAAEILGITLVDHLIVTSDDYVSLKEAGLI